MRSRSGSRCSGGTRSGMPASRIFRFARTSRCASVGSGTRNARAISGVVRPPTRLSVSATCASAASAGWQHAKISSSRSSGIAVSSSSGSCSARASSSVFRASVCSRRIRSIAPVARGGDDPGARVRRRRRRAASARPPRRMRPGRRPRRGRGRRGRGRGSRCSAHARRGRHGRDRLSAALRRAAGRHRRARRPADLDRAAQARGRNAGRDLERRVEVESASTR